MLKKKIAKYLLFKILSNNSNLDDSTFTSEKLGFTGREEGIASLATATVSKVE